jgi:hypothetical protein
MNMIANIKAVTLFADEALPLEWSQLTEDRAIGAPHTAEQEARLDAVLNRLDEVEAELIALPAETEEDACRKLRILERAISSGAQAEHILKLFDQCRDDFGRFGGASIID